MFFKSFRFPFFVSKRYLFAKKTSTAINFISLISVFGVMVGTMALVVVLSVFNGFDDLIKSLFSSFDPDIKITAIEGKTFQVDSVKTLKIKQIPGVLNVAEVIEENALLQYRDKQYIASIKGVSPEFFKVSGVEKKMVAGKAMINNGVVPFAVVGQGVAYYLSINLDWGDPLEIFVPRRTEELTLVPEEAFNKKLITPSGVFAIEQDVDSKYILVPLSFARKMLEYKNEITALEVSVDKNANIGTIQKSIASVFGKDFNIKDRYQQQELFYKIMKSEKWAIFFILSFILIVASLNIISSLTMLILEKRKDIKTLNNLGADWPAIRKIFLFNGWINSAIGAVLGLVLGLLICWAQIHFGIVKLEGSGSFVIDSYPVKVIASDIFMVLGAVIMIGFFTTWVPVRVISQKYFE